MIKVIRYSLFSGFYYWEKPVTGCLCRSSQNDLLIVAIRTQDCFSLSPESDENRVQVENSGMITDRYTSGFIQFPITSRHTDRLYIHPAVSSLGACPTPAL